MLAARGLDSLLWLRCWTGPATSSAPRPCSPGGSEDPRLSAQAPGLEALGELRRPRRPGHLRLRAGAGPDRVLEQVQALLLTTPPAWVAGFPGQGRYQSASGLAQIGGDFYDVVELDERELAFILADARGKGWRASSLAAVLKGAFRSLAGEEAGPARILSRLDRLVAREGGDEDFMTAWRAAPPRRPHPARLGQPPAPLAPDHSSVQVAAPLGLGTQAEELEPPCAPATGWSATPTGWSRPAAPTASSSTGRCSRRRSPPTPSPAPSTAWSKLVDKSGTPPAATTTTWPSSASNTTPRWRRTAWPSRPRGADHVVHPHKGVPMDVELSPEQEEFRKIVRAFAEEVVAQAEAMDRAGALDPVVLDQMAGMGLFGLPFPEEVGGMGADYTTLYWPSRLARVDSSVAITLEAAVSLGAMPIWRYGTAAQHDRWRLRPWPPARSWARSGSPSRVAARTPGRSTTWPPWTATSG